MTIQQAFDLALQHHQAGRLNEAESLYLQILAVEPSHADSMHNQGLIAHQVGRNDVALDLIRRVIALQPLNPEAYSNLGEACRVAGQFAEAVSAQRRAIDLRPAYPTAHYNLGVALSELGQLDEAIAAYREAIALRPDDPRIYNNLGNALKETGRPDEAVAAYRQALDLHPADPVALNNLGNALASKGQLDEAIAAYREATGIKPDFSDAHSNMLMFMNYHPSFEASAIAEEHRRWNHQHAEPLRPFIQSHPNDRSPDRRLRIGYLSPDFRDHSVAYFLEDLLEHQDPAQLEVFCYADGGNPDAVTARMRKFAGHQREISGQTDAQVAELIRSDGIDILVDLTGHTACNRLPVFARKPAPVQVTWLGYPNTTGLDAIDYRLTDAFAGPPGSTEHLHSEQLARLPRSAWCYRPLKHSPPESALPADEIGHITFGCFTALPKINDPLLELWAEILRAVPDSRLRLKNKALGEASVRRRIEAVPMVTLDSCVLRYEWSDIDFMKIDAEGEDANIIGGGKRFFEELSPLIQYEIKAEEPPNMLLLQDFAGRKSRNSSEFPRFSP